MRRSSPPGPPEVLLTFLALDAKVIVWGNDAEPSPLSSCRPSPQDILQEVVIPDSATCHGALARVARSPLDQAIVAAVAVVTDAVSVASIVNVLVEATERLPAMSGA